ncbi:amidohydrolase family protein [Streptomyces sp. NPDC051217]|uniref:amidohydrolase family protein n=1 Tax=Streptomyces sp. NPDC051217 TaxID=3365644 RepID=UPI0037B75010
MIDDLFVFDGVCHVYDMADDNLRLERPDTPAFVDSWRREVGAMRYPSEGHFGGDFEWKRQFGLDDMYKLMFVESPVDMAMACAVPVWDWFPDSFSPLRLNYEFAAANPDRVLLCGAVDPIHHGVDGALKEMEYQVRELGAKSFKFYNGHIDKSWRCDDREVAYPLYRKAAELGIEFLQFHKGLPFGEWDVDVLRPVDIQAPAREFRELKFVIHHLALPYFDEALSIAARFPNVYLALSGVMNYLRIAPVEVYHQIGRLLRNVGSHKLIWGSEASMTGLPGPFLKSFAELQIPEELCDGWGYPQITREDKRKILGENMAGLLGIDVPAKVKHLEKLGR